MCVLDMFSVYYVYSVHSVHSVFSIHGTFISTSIEYSNMCCVWDEIPYNIYLCFRLIFLESFFQLYYTHTGSVYKNLNTILKVTLYFLYSSVAYANIESPANG